MDTALDPLLDGVARRCGVIRTRAVAKRTILLLLRFRYHIITHRGPIETPLLAEACDVVAFRGRGTNLEWLADDEAESLLSAQPAANMNPQQASAQIEMVLDGLTDIRGRLEDIAKAKGEEILEAHRRVREAARAKGVRYEVKPQLPPDILGVYVLLPVV